MCVRDRFLGSSIFCRPNRNEYSLRGRRRLRMPAYWFRPPRRVYVTSRMNGGRPASAHPVLILVVQRVPLDARHPRKVGILLCDPSKSPCDFHLISYVRRIAGAVLSRLDTRAVYTFCPCTVCKPHRISRSTPQRALFTSPAASSSMSGSDHHLHEVILRWCVHATYPTPPASTPHHILKQATLRRASSHRNRHLRPGKFASPITQPTPFFFSVHFILLFFSPLLCPFSSASG